MGKFVRSFGPSDEPQGLLLSSSAEYGLAVGQVKPAGPIVVVVAARASCGKRHDASRENWTARIMS